MIDGKYVLELSCGNGSKCPDGMFTSSLAANGPLQKTSIFRGYNETHARAEARIAGWLFKADDVLCPKCAEPYQRKPRYPGRTL